MFTDYDRGDIPHLPKRCKHNWEFHCWFDDPRTCESQTHELRILIQRCKKCGKAKCRLVDVSEYVVIAGPDYADSIEEMLLGRPLNDGELRGAQLAIVLN